MKEVLLRSIKHFTATTIVLVITNISLVFILINQTNQYNRMLEQQTNLYYEILEEKVLSDNNVKVAKSADKIIPKKTTRSNKLGKFKLSWYSPKELGKQTPEQLKTSTGKVPREGRTIAVDPTVIPYGSIVYIEGYGYYIAEDTGGAIKGNRIDIFTASYETAIKNGRRTANVWIIGKI